MKKDTTYNHPHKREYRGTLGGLVAIVVAALLFFSALPGCSMIEFRNDVPYETLTVDQQQHVCAGALNMLAYQYKVDGQLENANKAYNLSDDIERSLEDKVFVRIPKENVTITKGDLDECIKDFL